MLLEQSDVWMVFAAAAIGFAAGAYLVRSHYAAAAAVLHEARLIANIAERVNEAGKVEEVLDHVYGLLRALLPYDRIGLAVLDRERIVLRAIWIRGAREPSGIPVGYEAPLAESSLGSLLESNEPRIINDLEAYAAEHPQSKSTRRILTDGVRSSLALPLRAFGQPVGALFLSSYEKHTYTPRHASLLRRVAGQVALVLARAQAQEKLQLMAADLRLANERLVTQNEELQTLATADALTGLANRRMFDTALQTEWRRLSRSGQPLSLLVIDVDLFKAFNDRYGHPAGDDCLRTVATVLAASSRRAGDVVARIGGEEFAVLLPETASAHARAVAENICKRMGELAVPHAASMIAPAVTLSIGVASMLPSPAVQPAKLVASADEALYRAKSAGRDRVMWTE